MKRYLTLLLIVTGFLTGIGAGVLLFRPALFRSAPRVAPMPLLVIDTSSTSPGAQPPRIKGTASAPVTLEEFGDFQCPPCRRLHQKLKQIESDDGPSLRLIYRHFPLTSIHRNALEAARAAEAAGEQGCFWEMHDWLYEHQETWAEATDARAVFTSYAQLLGLDTERFTQDMDREENNQRIVLDRQRGEAIGIRGTPTLFINNHQVAPTAMTPEGIREAINAASKR